MQDWSQDELRHSRFLATLPRGFCEETVAGLRSLYESTFDEAHQMPRPWSWIGRGAGSSAPKSSGHGARCFWAR